MSFRTSPYNTRSRLAVFEELPKKDKKPKRKYPKDEEINSTESQSSDCELVIDEVEPPRKKRVQLIKLSEEKITLKCKWNNCSKSFNDYYKFMTHLQAHPCEVLKAAHNKTCSWNKCDYKADTKKLLLKHVSFHGYIEKLRLIGQNVVKRFGLPNCTQNTTYLIPNDKKDYLCNWEDCHLLFVTYYDFLSHVMIHVHRNPMQAAKGESIKCCWQSCTYKCNYQVHLKGHVRTHTKEKPVACPDCCTTFATNTKLADHRKRQLPIQLLSYQCSRCSKLFASERLLRDHMRSHINHHKCTMCEMTCSKPSTLLKHMRYRHLNERPFKCHLCKHAAVTKNDLQHHLMTHCAEKLIACEECDYRCRTISALDAHYTVVHNHEWRYFYECHCCRIRYSSGHYLTKHLMQVHDYYWPAGHSRFRYDFILFFFTQNYIVFIYSDIKKRLMVFID